MWDAGDTQTEVAQEAEALAVKVKPRMIEIIRVVARHNSITVEDIKSPKRNRNIAWPRQMAAALCREMTTCSYPEIGRAFGDRDHTTILFGVRKVASLRPYLPGLDQALKLYADEIQAVANERFEAEAPLRITPAPEPINANALLIRKSQEKRKRERQAEAARWMALGGVMEHAL